MSKTVQEFVAQGTQQAMDELIAALLALPEEKRHWCPLDQGRSALDQIAECAVTNKHTAVLIKNAWALDGSQSKSEIDAAIRAVPNDGEAWNREKAEMGQDTETIIATLHENTEALIASIRAVSTDLLDSEIELPWEKTTASNVMRYPWWNMSYHEGQINYIATLLK